MGAFSKWWAKKNTRTLIAVPWVEDLAREAFLAGRRSAKKKTPLSMGEIEMKRHRRRAR